jgi:hypothetical protein
MNAGKLRKILDILATPETTVYVDAEKDLNFWLTRENALLSETDIKCLHDNGAEQIIDGSWFVDLNEYVRKLNNES